MVLNLQYYFWNNYFWSNYHNYDKKERYHDRPNCTRVCMRVYLEVIDAVAFTQSDLENFQHAEEGSQPTQTLLPAATNPHQQSITVGGLQDTTDTTPEHKHQN